MEDSLILLINKHRENIELNIKNLKSILREPFINEFIGQIYIFRDYILHSELSEEKII